MCVFLKIFSYNVSKCKMQPCFTHTIMPPWLVLIATLKLKSIFHYLSKLLRFQRVSGKTSFTAKIDLYSTIIFISMQFVKTLFFVN